MKLTLSTLCLTLLISSIPIVFSQDVARADTFQPCSPQTGMFIGSVGSPVADDIGSETRSQLAHQWLQHMMEPLQATGNGGAITPSQRYASDYEGVVSGTFTLASPTEIVSDSPLTVVTPRPLPDSYRGIVNGTSTYQSARYEVRAYLLVDIEYEHPAVIPASVGDDGTWTLDLSPIPQDRAGSWVFRLFDTLTDELVGQQWPQPEAYENIVVQSYIVADIPYLQDSQPARADNTWSFPFIGQGAKMFRLYNTSTNQILAEYYVLERTGLIRSYEYVPGQEGYGTSRAFNSYTYDQALALLVAIGSDDRILADELLQGLQSVQVTSGPFKGAFPSYADQRNPQVADTNFYTGANAIIAYAIARYYQAYGNQGGVQSMLEGVLSFIETQKTLTGPASGLYRGGGSMPTEGAAQYLTWHSTEHNIDLWHTFELTGRLLGGVYTEKSRDLSRDIIDKLWNTSEQRFNQGFQDTYYALDTASWGAIFLAAIGDYQKASQSLQAVEAYKLTYDGVMGYGPYLDYSSTPSVWFEGTFGAALAQRVVHDSATSAAAETLRNTYVAQGVNGAWQYVQVADTVNQFTDAFSVASTAWYLLATDYASSIWSECLITILDSTDEVIGFPAEKPISNKERLNVSVSRIDGGDNSDDGSRNEDRVEPPVTSHGSQSSPDPAEDSRPKDVEGTPAIFFAAAFTVLVIGVLGYIGYIAMARYVR